MKVNMREEFDATPDEVFAILADPVFQDAKATATSTGNYTARVDGTGDLVTIHTERHLPTATMPDHLRGFVGEHLSIVETQRWGPAEPDGSRHGVIDSHVKGMPVTLRGTVSLEPTPSGGSVEAMDAEIRASIPFLGGRVERAAAQPIETAARHEFRLVKEFLAR
ncbi:MAG TPA: DUF2505 domain-containing protein [Dermatophilaceae bacterium]|nr:DUF2505 domain-containing protein [Dermatophilaceae bacterium]